MKNIFRLLVSLITLITIFSCETDEVFQEEKNVLQNSEFQRLYEDILAIDDLTEQKIILSTFDSETQSALWQIKLNNFIKNNDLSDTQLEVINELKVIMNSDNFTKIKKDNKLRQRVKNLNAKVINSFNKNVGWYLLNKFENINQTLAKIDKKSNNTSNVESRSTRACNCEQNDSCARITGISIIGLSWEYGTCGGDCYVPRYFFGLIESDDTGRCSY